MLRSKPNLAAAVPFLAILLAAGVVRFWALDFGLPHTGTRPDEGRIVNVAVGMFDGDLNPHFYRYGSLYFYLLLGLFYLYYFFGRAIGWYGEFGDFIDEIALDPSMLHLLARGLTAFLGTATVYVTYRVARELFDRTTALLAAFFLALTYLHVRDSHFGVTDVPMTFFIMLSCLYIARSYNGPTVAHYALAGSVAGLATATKYAGALLVVPMGLAHVLALRRLGELSLRSLIDRRVACFALALVGAFIVAMPYAPVELEAITADVREETKHLRVGHGVDLGRGWIYHAKFSLWHGLGAPLLIASLLGIVLLAWRDRAKAALLLAFPLCFYAMLSRGLTVFVRYVIPVLPFLCITAAAFTYSAADFAGRRGGRRGTVVVAWTLATLLVVPSVINILKFDSVLGEEDTRVLAMRWFTRKAPSGSSTFHAGSKWSALEFLKTAEALQTDLDQALREEPVRRWHVRRIRARLQKLEEGARGYETWEFREGDRYAYRGQERSDRPDYITWENFPLVLYGMPPRSAFRILEGYELVGEFEGTDVKNQKNVFDQLDAFYVPYAGFERVDRPGPNLYIYKRTAPM